MKLAEHYGDKPPNELPMLFQRILSNCTLDWFRRQKTRNALFSNMSDFESVQRRRGFRPAGNFSVRRRLSAGGERRGHDPAGADLAGDRSRDPGTAGPSTRSLPDALLGGHGRGRNGGGHGLLGRQCQDTLFACGPGPQQGTEGKGNTTMTTTQLTAVPARQDRFGRQVAARLAAGTAEMPYDITERLRAARVQAVARAQAGRSCAPPPPSSRPAAPPHWASATTGRACGTASRRCCR